MRSCAAPPLPIPHRLQVLLGYDNRFAQACERHGAGAMTQVFEAAAQYDLSVLDKLAVDDETLLAWIQQRSSDDEGMRAWREAGMTEAPPHQCTYCATCALHIILCLVERVAWTLCLI